ncbi:MAG: OmpA family protein [Proteobacteria bacterium]|nr:OmpA family protein [Pseudomonadota bacterium]MBU1057641.1 OmpA family protein [Pseudomonadota bacterium]
MNRINQIIFQAIATGIFFTTGAMALEIRQQDFTFDMAITQNAESETFIIAEGSTSITQLSESCQMLMIYFQKESSSLSPEAAQEIIAKIRKNGVLPNTPLMITGHTCELGTDNLNQALSQKRAKTVAKILRGHGYSAIKVQGKGAQNPITSAPQEFYKNRRVEVEIIELRQLPQQ